MLTVASAVRFGTSLNGEANEALRAKIASLWSLDSSLFVDAALAVTNESTGEAARRVDATTCLLLDVHHLFLYHCPLSNRADSRALHALIRQVVGSYSPRPIDPLRGYWADRTFEFLHPLESLDVLAGLWPLLQPGHVVALSLGNGEITVLKLALPTRQHAAATDARPVTDDSLRRFPAQHLFDVASACADVVRDRQLRWSRVSMPIASAIAAAHGSRTACFGKGLRCRDAEAVAGLEVLERLHVALRWPEHLLSYASYSEMSSRAVDPRLLCYERPDTEPPNGLDRYGPHVPLYWTEATHAISGDTVLVPAQEIWYRTDLLRGEHRFVRTTTNGCAIGGSRDEAALFALLEAIERDAYLTMWYTRRPCRSIDLDALEDERCRMLHQRWRLCLPQYTIHVFDITTDAAVPTVAAIAVRPEGGSGPRTLHAAATRVTVAQSVGAALGDLSALVPDGESSSGGTSADLLANPELVTHPWHHFQLYSRDETFERLSFLPWQAPTIRPEHVEKECLDLRSQTRSVPVLLDGIVRHLQTLGIEVYLKDVTFPWLSERGLHCVKTVTPGLFPIWFGRKNRRFRVTDRLRRLAMRYAGRPLSEPGDFNLDIHPFS